MLKRMWNALLKGCSNFAGIALMFVVALIFVGVITRYVFIYSIPWLEELSRYLFVWFVLMSLGVTIIQNRQVRIDVIDVLIKNPTVKKVLAVITGVAALGIAVVLLRSSWDLLVNSNGTVSPALGLPMPFVYLSMVLGFIMTIIAMLVNLIKLFRPDEKTENGAEKSE